MNTQKRRFSRVMGVILAALMIMPGYAPFVFAEAKTGPGAGEDLRSFRRSETTLNSMAEKLKKGESAEETFKDDSVVVMFEDDTRFTKKKAKRVLQSGAAAVDDIKVEEVWNFDTLNGAKKNRTEDTASVALVSSDSLSGKKLAKKLAARKDIRYAERNHTVHALSVSDDEYSDLQWSMQDTEFAPNVGFEWNEKKVTGAEEKVVAVVDTGIDYTHPDIKDNMWKNTHYPKLKGTYGFDFIAGDGDPMDENGHGTHCAGIIGALGNNKTGISGVNQKVKLMALRILDADGGAQLSHEIAAYNYINDALDLGEPVVAINNSWGGGEESDIMKELVDIVGEKGAITVCAAGNAASNNDEEPDYPSSIDSEYLISVAATTRKGKLASFSNYGESVDVAAPGTDILSTVSYDSYLPTIYGEEQQNKVTEKYNGFDDESVDWAMPSKDSVLIDGMTIDEYMKGWEDVDEEDRPSISIGVEDGNVLEDSGKHAVITLKNLSSESLVCMPIKYTLKEGFVEPPHLSMMMSVDAPEGGDFFGSSLAGVIETSADKEPTLNGLGDEWFQGRQVSGEQDDWSHIDAKSFGNEEPVAGAERQFVVTLYAYDGGDYQMRLDDIGMSRQDVEKSEFGKYDIYSGTSMACPYITGSVALKTVEKEQEHEAGEPIDKVELVSGIANEITQMTKPVDPAFPIMSEGLFNFSMIPKEFAPRIGKVTVDVDNNTINIAGSGFDPAGTDVKVEVGTSDDKMKEAEIIEKDKKHILIKNEGWINNIENIKVTGYGPKAALKKNVYLVRGKKEYAENKDIQTGLSEESYTTDGKYIYNVDSRNKEITYFDPAQKEGDSETLATIDTDKLFPIEKDKKKKYGMLFDSDIVYMNGYIYAIVEFGAADEKEPTEDDDFWIFNKGKKAYDDEDEEGEENEDWIEGEYSIYSGEKKLIRVKTGAPDAEVEDLGGLENTLLEKTENYAAAAYNGNLYFVGGDSYDNGNVGEPSKTCIVYSPDSKEESKWSTAAELPEGRTGGKAKQYGDKLIYTLASGAKDNKDAGRFDIFTFDEKAAAWDVARNTDVKPFYEEDLHDINLVKSGILFTGGAVNDYGDTFVYDFAGKKLEDTGYNYIEEKDDAVIRAIAVGDTLYGFDTVEGAAYTMPIESGFVKVTGKKKGTGVISGTGWVVPGNDAKVTVKAGKNFHIKSIKVGGKAVKVKKNAKKQVVTIKRPAGDQTVSAVFVKDKQVKVTVKKTGKGKVKGAKKYFVGQKVKLTVTAAKGNYIKSLKVGTKNVKLKGKPAKKVYTIKKIKKNTKVKVGFAKK